MIADIFRSNNTTASDPRRGSHGNAKCFTDAAGSFASPSCVAGGENYSSCFTDAETEALRNKSMSQ
jgi:hypothetical protein